MKVGLFAVVAGRVGGMAVMKAFAQNAERVGFSTLWAPEHVVLLDSYASRYPYRDDGTLPAPTDAPFADPFLTLCTMASVTQRFASPPASAWCPSTIRWCWPRWSRRSTR